MPIEPALARLNDRIERALLRPPVLITLNLIAWSALAARAGVFA